ncbi:MAG TPA: tail fiber domain-containing protein, partial [Casimicrobiaceae bacterium]|nr:tail fiber domain-containing protein [Casimicrobiaceae bacterium]
SDRNAKENFAAVDAADILRKLVAMPISTWNFKGGDPRIRSLGPTAQDFYAAFALGNDDKTIATSNLASVGLAAIQGLHTLVQQQAAELAALRAELKAMRAGLADLPRASVDERVAGD